MIVQKAWADREPEQARKFLVAYYLAVERLKQQREEAAEVALRHVASRDLAAIAGELDALVWHGLEAQRRLLTDPPLQGLAREVTRLLRDEDGALGLASPISDSPALEEWVALDLLAP